jgi:hypothetical protein
VEFDDEAGAVMGLGIGQFRDTHKGETIWVLGSGATLDHVPRAFWSGLTVVAVNHVGIKLGLQQFYAVTHYHMDAAEVAEARPDIPVITPIIDQGGPAALAEPPGHENIHFAKTGTQAYSRFDCAEMWPKEPETLVIGPTGIHMTMHFAQYLGARSIILAGVDCGTLDGRHNFDGYSKGDNPFSIWDDQLPKVANALRAEGVTVMSLNPFVNLAIEGHSFAGPSVSIN